ncbi:MAG: HlyD family efflux transporter periplasmic adaptor subunit [Pseudomonadota bacterium]
MTTLLMHSETAPSISGELFRSEALAETLDTKFGALRLAQPISNWVIAFLSILFVAMLAIFLVHGELDKKAVVIGITQPIQGSLAVVAPNAGILVNRFVAEGEAVRAGQRLFEISTARQNSGGELTSLIARQLDARSLSLDSERRNRRAQNLERQSALSDRRRNLDAEEVQILSEIEFVQRRRAFAQRNVEQYTALKQVNFASAAQLQEKEEALIDLDSRISALTRSKVQLNANRLSLHAEQKELSRGLISDLIQLDRTSAALKQEVVENENRRSTLILAPEDGVVTTITYKSGQGVLNGQVLATLVSRSKAGGQSDSLEIHLYVPSRTAGFIAQGQEVYLRYQAYPFQKFGLQRGVVVHVGDTPFAPNELPSNVATTILSNAQQSTLGLTNNEALYRVRVRPEFQFINAYGKQKYLKPGMSLSADVIQERRHIWEWIVDPVYALRGRP